MVNISHNSVKSVWRNAYFLNLAPLLLFVLCELRDWISGLFSFKLLEVTYLAKIRMIKETIVAIVVFLRKVFLKLNKIATIAAPQVHKNWQTIQFQHRMGNTKLTQNNLIYLSINSIFFEKCQILHISQQTHQISHEKIHWRYKKFYQYYGRAIHQKATFTSNSELAIAK